PAPVLTARQPVAPPNPAHPPRATTTPKDDRQHHPTKPATQRAPLKVLPRQCVWRIGPSPFPTSRNLRQRPAVLWRTHPTWSPAPFETPGPNILPVCVTSHQGTMPAPCKRHIPHPF